MAIYHLKLKEQSNVFDGRSGGNSIHENTWGARYDWILFLRLIALTLAVCARLRASTEEKLQIALSTLTGINKEHEEILGGIKANRASLMELKQLFTEED